MTNPITFVSLGPGEPELITLKGLKKLQEADHIFCPSTNLKSGKTSSRARDILVALDIDESKIRLFDVPMNKDRSAAIDSYHAVAQTIASAHKQDEKIVVTAEGDAGFYSSSHYIVDQLDSMSVPSVKVAGVPAFISCGALANIHVVKQEEELHVVPGVIALDELKQKIEARASIVIMKTSQCESVIKQAMTEMPQATFHYFENAGLAHEYYTKDNAEILQRKFPYFSLIIIHA